MQGEVPVTSAFRQTGVQIACVAGLLLAAPAAPAQHIDYDSRRSEALRRCDVPLHRGRVLEAQECFRSLLSGSRDALQRAEAQWALGEIQAANDEFRQAVAAAEKEPYPRVRWARLFLAMGQYSDAGRLFEEAIELAPKDPGARVGIARLSSERFSGDVSRSITELLAEDDSRVEAHLVAARIALELGQWDPASRSAQRALQLTESQQLPPLEPLTLLAGIESLRGRDPEPRIRSALAFNPRYGSLFESLGYFEVIRRRYREADSWLKRAVEVQPDLWSAQRERGLNLMRLGNFAEGRVHLERAYSGDRFSTATVNTLRLLDSLNQYETIQIPEAPLTLLLHKSEAAAMRPYVEAVARDAITQFSRRYGYTPREPIILEFYPNHDDFAVRTAGLPGIGLLGVTFGHVVAMDSPAGRKAGDFHWGSVLWHEMAHVFTLSATRNRVPRWVSEGLSVFEEWRFGPTPGVAVDPPVLDAFAADKFLPVARLDEGFLRPTYENQIQISYAQAGLVSLFAEQRFGLEAMGRFLKAFDSDMTTAEAVKQIFKIEPAAFDAEFNRFMKQRFAPYLAGAARWKQQMRAAHEALEAKQWSAAREAAEEAIKLLPEFTADGSAYEVLSGALEGEGNHAAQMSALLAWRKAGGWNPGLTRKLGALLLAADRQDEARNVLDAVNYADPLAVSGHAQLGDLWLNANRGREAQREFEVLMALAPLDAATAHFGLARAHRLNGEARLARRHVLLALETAPNFRPAQRLLLELTGERTP